MLLLDIVSFDITKTFTDMPDNRRGSHDTPRAGFCQSCGTGATASQIQNLLCKDAILGHSHFLAGFPGLGRAWEQSRPRLHPPRPARSQ
ncbi:Putative protein of unknown function [Podospora comata]|uniref:Uncharacterized protein n=1 Tax=Podospora comata TaxID=48703 RepID=A0ABY6RY36_PODCO|nr:Putative protein of unknown function [Podospora comata]